ncbi:hypothetical protein [Armatimonas sp.]|uniref:hypothetical protein n=1 Tax=Armatimonas sp. TaxID=1872638 RepID=UPI00374C933C
MPEIPTPHLRRGCASEVGGGPVDVRAIPARVHDGDGLGETIQSRGKQETVGGLISVVSDGAPPFADSPG